MTPEVKQRIDQIRQGIVPKGYKKTKTAIVPADWKESPIGEYIREYTEKTTIPNQYPVLTSARTGLMLQTDYYSNRQVTTEDNVGYNVLPYGYITFRSRSDDGRFRFNENRIIERGIISYFYPVFSFSEEVCHEYMLYLLNFSIYRRMYPYAEGTAQQVLSLKKLGQLKYSLPLVAEQRKIAEILSTQDKAIELQERKIDELKRFKKGCLEKMFPRKGQKVPEKRFSGFTDDWERRKLGSIYEAIGNAFVGTATPYYVENGHFYLESNNIKDGQINHNTEVFINDEFYEKQKDKWLHTGDMVMVQSGHVGHAAVIPEELDNSAAHALIMFRHPKIEIEPYFLNYQYQTLKSKKKIENITTGNTIKHILASDMQQFEVDMPKLEERKKIAEYFRGLDRLIALHQCKLEEMKRQKKALMQLLLTGIVRI